MGKAHPSDIESGVGFLGTFLSTLMGFVRENGVPFEAIHRLGRAGGRQTVKKIVDLAYADWQAEQPKPIELPQNGHPYRGGGDLSVQWIGEVEVNYGVRPSFDDLNGKWFDWANNRYRDVEPQFRSERADAPTTGIETTRYGYVWLNRLVKDEEALEEIKGRGVKPATDLETMTYGKKFPEEQRKFPVVGLGSFFKSGGCRYSAVLHWSDRERGLDLDWGSVAYPWGGGCRFLVRE